MLFYHPVVFFLFLFWTELFYALMPQSTLRDIVRNSFQKHTFIFTKRMLWKTVFNALHHSFFLRTYCKNISLDIIWRTVLLFWVTILFFLYGHLDISPTHDSALQRLPESSRGICFLLLEYASSLQLSWLITLLVSSFRSPRFISLFFNLFSSLLFLVLFVCIFW